MAKNKGKIDYVTIYYTNNTKLESSVNPNLTDKEVYDYYKVGRVFNVGRGEHDYFQKVKKVVIHRLK